MEIGQFCRKLNAARETLSALPVGGGGTEVDTAKSGAFDGPGGSGWSVLESVPEWVVAS